MSKKIEEIIGTPIRIRCDTVEETEKLIETTAKKILEHYVPKTECKSREKEAVEGLKLFIADEQDKKKLRFEHLQLFWLVIDKYLQQEKELDETN